MKISNPNEVLKNQEYEEYKKIEDKHSMGEDITQDIIDYNKKKKYNNTIHKGGDILYRSFTMELSLDFLNEELPK